MYPTTRLTRPHWMTYGLGWFQQDYHGRAVDFHTGSIDGMVAIHGLIRDERLGVYVLGNLDHAEVRHALMYTVFDRYAGASDRDWSAEFLKLYGGLRTKPTRRARKRKRRVAGTSPSLPLPQFAGDYADPLHGDVEVTDDAGGLGLRYGAAFVGTLEHWHFNTFRATWKAVWRAPELVNFVLDSRWRASHARDDGRALRPPAVALLHEESRGLRFNAERSKPALCALTTANPSRGESETASEEQQARPAQERRLAAGRHRSRHRTIRHRPDRSCRCCR